MTRSAPATFDGFVRADGGRLVDGQGRPRLLRGVGLGNWLLPEGYMWRFADSGPQSPRQIEAFIEDLVGPIEAAAFWQTFRDRFIAEADIEQMAADGFDHVRLPINSRLLVDDDCGLLDEGVERIDSLIDWCRTHGLWVVLDLHGAPGGQTGTNIDDSPKGLPDLFLQGGSYRTRTVSLWSQLARRYRDEPVVAGYDLLNEPLPNEYQGRFADSLVALYREVTAAIRAVDSNHLIIYEGTHWSTNWSIFNGVWDENSMLQFHKYWSPPDRPSIARFIETGRRLGLPIYMGEGGENNAAWLQTAFQLYEDCDISWNLWPWKKVDTITSPRSVRPPIGWDSIRAYAERRGPRPAAPDIARALDGLLDGICLENTDDRSVVVNAVFRRVPLRLPATGFGFGGPGIAYDTTGAQPMAGFRADESVTIRQVSGQSTVPDFSHDDGRPRAAQEGLELVLDRGDWVAYDIDVVEPAVLRVRVEGDPTSRCSDKSPAISIGADPLSDSVVDGSVVATTDGPIMAGRTQLRLTARTPETVIRSVEVTPAASGGVTPVSSPISRS